ncbi:MAG: hypothetical protein C0172_03940 [Caldisphaera sp.]|nr:MAG: hypothetical protein C0172_03940 [Caldisphaera sp.]
MGIGPNGKSLRDILEESDKLYKNTGCYYGLCGDLELYKKNPLKWERDRARLRSIMVTSREMATHIAASPITRSIGETCWVLFTPEGDSIVISTGIIVHVHTMSEEIKWMIKMGYEDNPGIKDGDMFVGNDPAIGNVHTTDVHELTPIFYNRTLVGWIGSVTHQVDIGANTPGHDITTSTSRFEDGLYMEAELTIRDGKMFPHYFERSRRGVRTPLYYDLDEKARIAGNEMARREVLKFIQENGLDYYLQFIREIIEKSRRDFIERTKERLVPGRYRSVTFADSPLILEAWQPQARDDWLHPLSMEINITENGFYNVDIEGSTGTGPYSWNGGISPFMGGFWVVMTQLIGYSEIVNEGYVKAIAFKFPEKSWASDTNPYLSRQVPWYFLIPGMIPLYRAVAYGAFSRGIIEEGGAGYGMTADALQGGGYTNGRTGHPPNIYYPISTFEIAGQGLGANAVRDGLDNGFAMWNPEADIGDVEEWERIQWGFIYLARKIRANSAGHGEHRGGSGYAHVAIFYGSQDNILQNLNMGKVFVASGLHGGYPNATSYTLTVRMNASLDDLIKDKVKYPLSDDPLNPEFETTLGKYTTYIERLDYATHYPRALNEFDFHYFKQNGGPGWGDPIDRPYDSCEKDLNEGIYTAEIMEKVYGVKAIYDSNKGIWLVDRDSSEKLREKIKKERLSNSIPFEDFYKYERDILIKGEIIRPIAKMYYEQSTISPKWWNEFKDFWQLPNEWVPLIEDKEHYLDKVILKHKQLIDEYRSYLKLKGYDINQIRHVTLSERR